MSTCNAFRNSGYPVIEAPMPEDMQSLIAQLRAQKKDKETPTNLDE